MTALPQWVDKDAWEGFQAMRKSIKKPMTPRAEMLILKTLYALKVAGHDPNEALDQSTLCNWQMVFEPKKQAITQLTRETYKGDAPMTPEERAASEASRKAVMEKLRPTIRRVA